jgi:hypothetical protein
VIRAGSTSLVFADQGVGEAIYHFAFNVPARKFAEAKAWLATDLPARPLPTELLIEAASERHYALPAFGYSIVAIADRSSRLSGS